MNRKRVEISLIQKGILPITIAGISMYPTLQKGETCYCRKRDQYHVGDIVLFVDANGEKMAHRIIAIRGDKYITKGDNWYHADEPCKREDIIGEIIVSEINKEKVARLSRKEAILCRFLPGKLHYQVKKWKRRAMKRIK